MYQYKLCIGLTAKFEISMEEQIRLYKQAGFDGFFTVWDGNEALYRKVADEQGLIYQSVHGPNTKTEYMWQRGEKAKEAIQEFKECVAACADNQIPIMIMHTYVGFGRTVNPDPEAAKENYRQIVEEAAAKNVKIAFENAENEEYLAIIMEEFKDCSNVGFCWDTGHEMCYCKGVDMIKLYGDRLIGTHLNDNLGIRNYDGVIDWMDDLHLLPFDGIGDWQNIADRLNQCGYNGIMTFELKTESKVGRHDNDKYNKMSVEEYLAEAYARTCRVAALRGRNIS